MVTIEFEIPDEVATFIETELKMKPKTYIQNELITPILDKYHKSLKTKKLAEATAQVDKDITTVKNAMQIKLDKVK